MRVLQVEDDGVTAQTVELMLKSEGMTVFTTDLGEEGCDLAKHYAYEIILLDLNLPDMSGLEVLRTLRAAKISTPVLVLTGTSAIETKVRCFRAGADDYMTKPFHKDELVERIRAIVRRSAGLAESAIHVGPITVNLDSKTVSVDGQPVHLTGKEYQIMELLALRRGSTLTKDMFLNHLYGGRDEPELKIVDVFICKVRNKLRQFGVEDHVETVWGRGYRLVEAPAKKISLLPARTSSKTRILVHLARADADFRTLAGVALYSNDTVLRSTLAAMMDEGQIINVGPPRAALYQITDAGRRRLPKEAA